MPMFKFLIILTQPSEEDSHSDSGEDQQLTVCKKFESKEEARKQECFHSDEHKSDMWEFYCPDEFKSQGCSDGSLDVIYVGPVSDEERLAIEEDMIQEALRYADR